VNVFARNPSNLRTSHVNLNVTRATLRDKQDIENTIRGCDAVISVLGPNEMSNHYPITEGMGNIVEAMKKLGVRRIIATTTPSTKDPRDKYAFKFRLTDAIIKMMMRNVYDDSLKSVKVIRESDLDWTIIRVPFLSNKRQKGEVITGYPGDGRMKLLFLNRADLAEFLLSQVEDRSLVRELPMVSNSKNFI
jgi:putative NADH-flavin reductase